jgi:phage terminase small subunit
MALDVKQFAAELGLSPEDQATLFGLFDKNPGVGDKLTGLMTTQVEAALTPLKADLARKSKDLDDQFATLDSVRGGDAATLEAANRRVEQAVAAVTTARERLRRMATDFGADPEAWSKDIEVPGAGTPPHKPAVPAAGPAPVESPMDAQRILATAGLQAWNALRSGAELNDIATEHAKIFGTPLPNQLGLLDRLQDRVKRTGNGNLTLREIWQEEYKVVDKQRELQEADIKRRETDAYERGKREAADAAALGTQHNAAPPPFVQSPVLAQLTKDTPAHVAGVPEGVLAAISDYRQRRLNAKPA